MGQKLTEKMIEVFDILLTKCRDSIEKGDPDTTGKWIDCAIAFYDTFDEDVAFFDEDDEE